MIVRGSAVVLPPAGARRGPSEMVIALCLQSGIHLKAWQLRDWVRRGKIRRYPQGYDLDEVAGYLRERGLLDTPHAATCEDPHSDATLVPAKCA